MERKRKNANFINGIPELLVLKLLSDDKLYGYQLVKEIQKLNPQAFDFGEGCIYPILHNLEKDGLLKSDPVDVNGRTRLYYSTTDDGRVRLDELSSEWLATIEGVGKLFGAAFDFVGQAAGGISTMFQILGKSGSSKPRREEAERSYASGSAE